MNKNEQGKEPTTSLHPTSLSKSITLVPHDLSIEITTSLNHYCNATSNNRTSKILPTKLQPPQPRNLVCCEHYLFFFNFRPLLQDKNIASTFCGPVLPEHKKHEYSQLLFSPIFFFRAVTIQYKISNFSFPLLRYCKHTSSNAETSRKKVLQDSQPTKIHKGHGAKSYRIKDGFWMNRF